MSPPEWLHFFERRFPSANMALVRGDRPVLIDTGYGSDFEDTVRLLEDAGVPPSELHLAVNTHYHSDHIGGNHSLQRRYGVPLAAHRWDAELVARRHRDLGACEWLDQPVEPYRVDRALDDGDEIDCGGVILKVLHVPGHTQGQIALYEPESQVLIAGDAFHRFDVGWINRFREGLCCLRQALESLDRLAALPVRWACSGHGPAIADPAAALEKARRRYESWLGEPEKEAWHATKRIFAYALMLRDGVPREDVPSYLLGCGWFQDFSRWSFGFEPADFVDTMLDAMLGSKAAVWRDGRLVASTAYSAAPEGWRTAPGWPREWPGEGE